MARLKIGLVRDFATAAEWEAWLAEHHASEPEVWLRLAKKGADAVTVTRAEAVEVALCYGWIDGQARTQDAKYWLQRFTPRRKRSRWSRINCEIVDRLTAEDRMRPAGLSEVDAAKRDGRWAAAYASPANIEVPEDLLARLAQSPAAATAFDALDARNRYAILYRIEEAKRPETRAGRIERFIGMLERGERIH